MPRCFPYPPPGYALSRVSKDALIESIKFQNKEVKSKEQRKQERKRKRKEKRKEKRANAKHKHVLLPKGCKAEPGQQLEGSSITEEYGKPLGLSAPSTSSESTEHSNKRKGYRSQVGSRHGHGKIIRMRLPLKKTSQTSGPANEQNEQPCSTSGRSIDGKSKSDCVRSAAQPIEILFARKTPNHDPSKTSVVVTTPMQKLELQYINLMDSLVPPQQQDSCLDEAEVLDWLLKSKNRELCVDKKSVSGNEVILSSGLLGLWRFAQYLEEVDVYCSAVHNSVLSFLL